MKLLILLAALAAPITPDAPARDAAAPPPPPAGPARRRPARPRPPPDRAAWPPSPAGRRPSALGVIGSKHDLSTSGPGPFKSDVEGNACAFCHVPHGGDHADGRPARVRADHPLLEQHQQGPDHLPPHRRLAHLPLLPRRDHRHGPDAQRGSSSCATTRPADGSPPATAPTSAPTCAAPTPSPSCRRRRPRSHPPMPDDPVHLDRTNQLQCTACHDPHRERLPDTGEGQFLVKTMRRAELCLTCHDAARLEAPDASHRSSTSPITDPATGTATTLADLRCAACHVPHNADKRGRLVRPSSLGDDAMCLSCHDGKVTSARRGRPGPSPLRPRRPHDRPHRPRPCGGAGRRRPPPRDQPWAPSATSPASTATSRTGPPRCARPLPPPSSRR